MREYHIDLKLLDKKEFKKKIQFFITKKLEVFLLLIVATLSIIWKLDFKTKILILFGFLVLIIIIERDGDVLLRSFKKGWQSIINQKSSSILLIIILFLLLIWDFNLESMIFLMIFLIWLFYDWDSRIIVSLAFISLASCPFLLIYKKNVLSEQMAVYAYYFLVMTIVLQMVEYCKDRGKI